MISKSLIRKMISLADGKNVCSRCIKETEIKDGDFSHCCDDIVVTSSEMLKAIGGKLPKINLTSTNNKPNKTKSKVDIQSGIRIGTKKHEAFLLFKKGVSIKEAIKTLQANESSMRSWFGRFRKHEIQNA